MKKDNLTDVDVVNTLRGGVVQPAEWENGSWRYRVLTQRMAAVAAFEPDVEAVPADEDDVAGWNSSRSQPEDKGHEEEVQGVLRSR